MAACEGLVLHGGSSNCSILAKPPQPQHGGDWRWWPNWGSVPQLPPQLLAWANWVRFPVQVLKRKGELASFVPFSRLSGWLSWAGTLVLDPRYQGSARASPVERSDELARLAAVCEGRVLLTLDRAVGGGGGGPNWGSVPYLPRGDSPGPKPPAEADGPPPKCPCHRGCLVASLGSRTVIQATIWQIS